MKTLSLHDDAEVELTQAILSYARENEDIAVRFFQQVTDAFSRMVDHPKIGSAVARDFRKVVLTDFPYNIYYKEFEVEIKVATIAHHARKPGYWHGRI